MVGAGVGGTERGTERGTRQKMHCLRKIRGQRGYTQCYETARALLLFILAWVSLVSAKGQNGRVDSVLPHLFHWVGLRPARTGYPLFFFFGGSTPLRHPFAAGCCGDHDVVCPRRKISRPPPLLVEPGHALPRRASAAGPPARRRLPRCVPDGLAAKATGVRASQGGDGGRRECARVQQARGWAGGNGGAWCCKGDSIWGGEGASQPVLQVFFFYTPTPPLSLTHHQPNRSSLLPPRWHPGPRWAAWVTSWRRCRSRWRRGKIERGRKKNACTRGRCPFSVVAFVCGWNARQPKRIAPSQCPMDTKKRVLHSGRLRV